MSFKIGESVGPYRIIEQLGQGGMATVFKAYHASLDRYVALKVLHPAFNQDPNFEARFQREARVVAKLEHANIVPVYDYAEHDKRPYLVMKFIEGITLKARMDQGRLTSDEITRIVDAVGAALGYAHKQGVLHRDIKPSNVLLASDGQIYLADFGLARIAQAGESTLSSDSIMGTPQYISPEQAMGKGDLDQRTDLYSFGVMLYEMVVGKVPFNADTPFSIIHDHIYTPLPLPRVVNPSVPEPVERVLLKALAKEREDRFDDAQALIAGFKSAWGEAGVPMQGSDLKASQVLRSDVQTVAQPEPVKTKAIAEKQPVAAEAAAGPKKKRVPWMWVSAGLVICLCLGFLAFARENRLFSRLTADSMIEPMSPEEAQVLVDVAKLYAQENPEDPDAQLELALAYWDADMPLLAYESVANIVELVDADDDQYFIDAGDEFADREAWVPAAGMYFQVVKYYQSIGEDAPQDVIDAFQEAAYKGAERTDAIRFLQNDSISEVDPLMSFVTKARNSLYNDRPSDGTGFLNQAQRLDPQNPMVLMLGAEFEAENGNMAEARAIVEEILQKEDVPDWLILFGEDFLDRTN